MPRLLVQRGNVPPASFDLRPGANLLGSDQACSIWLPEESVSGQHCEIILADNTAWLRDLGSANGTSLDGEPIQQAPLHSGGSLRLGNVELIYLVDAVQPASSPAGPTVNQVNVPVAEPSPRRGDSTFFQALGGAFRYPLVRSGPALVISGGVFITLLQWASFLASYAPLYGIVAVAILSVLGGGYFFSYLQDVILTSAQGEDSLPWWPEISTIADTFVFPFLRGLFLLLLFVGPAVLVGAQITPLAGFVVGLLCGFFFPMALLGVAMADGFGGLNPLVLLPSIAKVIGPYLAAVAVLVVVAVGSALLSQVATMLPIPLLPTLIVNLISFYGLTVEMRIIGLIYHKNKETLGWFA